MSISKKAASFLVIGILMNTSVATHAGEFYVGASYGQAEYEGFDDAPAIINDGSFTSASADDADAGMRVFFGAAINTGFSVELGYVDLGDFTVDAVSDGSGFLYAPGNVDMTVSVDGLDLSLVSKIPVGRSGSFNVRFGFFMWDANLDLSDSTGSLSTGDDGSDVFVAFAGEYRISDQVGLRGEYTFYNVDDDDLNLLSASLVYYFDDHSYR